MRNSWQLALLSLAGLLSLGGCVSSALPGIPMQSGAADPELQALARRATRQFDQRAQLELGIRYEYGRGVPVNWKLAGRLYAQAAMKTPSGLFSMGAGGKLTYEPQLHRDGIPEAKQRLAALRAKMAAAGIKCTGIGWSAIVC